MMHKKVKYIVVGQGLAGTILSYQLLKRGIKHVVVGSNLQGTSSLVAAGMFNPLVFKRITKSWLVDDLFPVMKTMYEDLEGLLGRKFIYNLPIAKLISPDEKEWWNSRINSQQIESYFKGFLPSGQLQGVRNSFEVAQIDQSGYVNLHILLSAYRKLLIEQGAYVNSLFDYHTLKLNAGAIEWGNIKAESIIFCEGAAGSKNPFFTDVKFHLTKGEVLEVEIEGLTQEYIVNKDVFLLPIGNQRYRLGSTYDNSDLTWIPNEKAAEKLIARAEKLINGKIKLVDHKAGIRPTIRDRRPVLGQHHKYQELYIFNGLGTKGVMLAPYFARQMVDLLENKIMKVNKEVRLERFYSNH